MLIKNNNNHSGLRFEIEKYENATLEGGDNSFIIYLIVDNQTSNTREIYISKANYITHKREQLEQDIWLSGYIVSNDTLMPNSFKKAGLIFYKNKLKWMQDDDIIYISIKLPHEGKKHSLTFKMINKKWELFNIDTSDIEIKLTKKQMANSFLSKIERLDAFEEKFNITLERLSINIRSDDGWFNLLGEIHPRSGVNITEKIKLLCVIYDKEGSVIIHDYYIIYPEDFYGFKIFEFKIQEDNIADKVGNIRLYPQIY